jgi:L-lactate dehydrogenase (cytochrome)/(S)-mandelate dehydrogenase
MGTFVAYNIFDLRELAKKRLPKGLFEFVDRGTEDEVALRNNRAVFERIRFKPRTLVDVSKRSLDVTLFGNRHKMPLVIAPTGMAGLLWHEGEIALARAAAEAGIPLTLSTSSITSMERVAAAAGGTLWFQLSMRPDRSQSYQMIERAQAAGYQALVVTVDTRVSPNREYNLRNQFRMPFTYTRKNVTDALLHPRWTCGVLGRYVFTTGMPRFENYPKELQTKITGRIAGRLSQQDDSLDWDDLRDLRKRWPRKLLVKGVLHPEDAISAADCGADGVVVSNHGGRNLDSAISPLEILPQIVDAVGKRITVLIDSGFRRGSDVVKALALGAHAVQIGRAGLYGIGAAGQPGAQRALAIFRDEIDRVMALLGCRSPSELSPAYLHDRETMFKTFC